MTINRGDTWQNGISADLLRRTFASAIITPAVPLVMTSFNSTADTEGSLCVSIFVSSVSANILHLS
jgi:hypothetical protein